MSNYPGINYGPLINVNLKTGIRYGVIPVNKAPYPMFSVKNNEYIPFEEV